jgi:hypothetical protein
MKLSSSAMTEGDAFEVAKHADVNVILDKYIYSDRLNSFMRASQYHF